MREIRVLTEIAKSRNDEIRKRGKAVNSSSVNVGRTFSRSEALNWLELKHMNQLSRLISSAQKGDDKKIFQREDNGHYRFSIQDLHYFADKIGLEPFQRPENADPAVITVANLKGGNAKTTSGVNIAKALAYDNKRYRVGYIDADPQGTGTLFGYPDLSDDDFTVGDVMQGDYDLDDGECEKSFILSCFKQSTIPNFHVLPAKVDDFFFETYAEKIQSESPEKMKDVYRILKEKIIDAVKDDFDIIFIDTAPSLNKMLYNAIYAANGIIIPVVPEFISFDATFRFLERFEEIYYLAAEAGHSGYDFIRMLVANYDPIGSEKVKSVHRTYYGDLKKLFADRVIPEPLRHSLAIPICADSLMTPLDMRSSDYPKSKSQLDKAVENINEVALEVELLVHRCWGLTTSFLQEV